MHNFVCVPEFWKIYMYIKYIALKYVAFKIKILPTIGIHTHTITRIVE